MIDPAQTSIKIDNKFKTLKKFYIDKYEVTIKDYFDFIQKNAYKKYRGYQEPAKGGERKAVTRIHFFDAFKYCHWKGKTLPTELEWEFAASGGARTYPWGEEPVSGERANYCDLNCPAPWSDYREDDHYKRIAPVGSYPAGITPQGVADMAGNLWEITRTSYDSGENIEFQSDRNYSQEILNESITIKGGSYGSKPEHLKTTVRRKSHVTFRSSHVGFRCIKY